MAGAAAAATAVIAPAATAAAGVVRTTRAAVAAASAFAWHSVVAMMAISVLARAKTAGSPVAACNLRAASSTLRAIIVAFGRSRVPEEAPAARAI